MAWGVAGRAVYGGGGGAAGRVGSWESGKRESGIGGREERAREFGCVCGLDRGLGFGYGRGMRPFPAVMMVLLLGLLAGAVGVSRGPMGAAIAEHHEHRHDGHSHHGHGAVYGHTAYGHSSHGGVPHGLGQAHRQHERHACVIHTSVIHGVGLDGPGIDAFADADGCCCCHGHHHGEVADDGALAGWPREAWPKAVAVASWVDEMLGSPGLALRCVARAAGRPPGHLEHLRTVVLLS